MIQSYTINAEKSHPLLRRIADVPGVRHVAVLDAAGLCLAHTGHEPVSTMLLSDWTVIARAAFAACDELGQRCGAGPCQESLQTNRDGGTLMRAMTGGMLLIVQYESRSPVGTLRLVVAEVSIDLPIPIEARPNPRRPQASDPFAGGAWSSDASSHQPPQRPRQTSVVVDA